MPSKAESEDFISNQFQEMKNNNSIKVTKRGFNFSPVSLNVVKKLMLSIENSASPGITGIPIKVIKANIDVLAPIIQKIFNYCIANSIMPDEWKEALVTILYKGKGDPHDMNSYRGISILSIFAKLFREDIGSPNLNLFQYQ